MIARTIIIASLMAAGSAPAQPPPPRWTVEFEIGNAWNSINDVQIPNDASGTRFSLTDDLDPEDEAVGRARLAYRIGDRSRVWGLVAPLTVRSTGVLDRDLHYDGDSFAAGTPLTARFRFNSYRLGYLYQLADGERFDFSLGLTGKVRDAFVEVSSDTRSSRYDNVGFVPLVGFELHWRLAGSFALRVEGDALAAPQGRAEDIRAALFYTPVPSRGFFAGYRVLEGGADNDKVYTFSLFHYAVAGVWAQL